MLTPTQIHQILESIDWQIGIKLLELYQNELQVDRPHALISTFFEVLKQLLQFKEDIPAVEYVKQLLLSSILISCQKNIEDKTKLTEQKLNFKQVLKVELIVQCIRCTQNPQTHHQALLLLAQIAVLCPEQVLLEIVVIFTFMGSSVARYDDEYSFKMMSQIIEEVLPKIVEFQSEKHMVAILRVFADIILDVPNHRRCTVYQKLLKTLNADDYLWIFMAVLLDSHVRHVKKDKTEKEKNEFEDLPHRIEIALNISRKFSIETHLLTSCKLIKHIFNLHEETNTIDTEIFDIKIHTAKELRFYRYACCQLVKALLTSNVNIENVDVLQPLCSNLIAETLACIPSLLKTSGLEQRQTYWKVILNHYYDILACAIGFLTPDLFLKTVNELIQKHKIYIVRIKVIEILSDKLQYHPEYFKICEEDNIINLLEPFKEILNTIAYEKEVPQVASTTEWWTMQQLTLTCLKLLSRIYSKSLTNNFIDILDFLVEKIERGQKMSEKVLGSFLLCLAELSANLKTFSISYMHRIVPIVIDVLNRNTTSLLQKSAFAAIYKISEALPTFLSPFIEKMLLTLANLYRDALSTNDEKMLPIRSKLKTFWRFLAKNVPSRVMIPAIHNSYEQVIANNNYNAVGPVIELSIQCFDFIPIQEFQSLQLTEFFLHALQFRCDQHCLTNQEDINHVEDYVLKAFCALVLKLSEASFRTLYFKIYDWTFEKNSSRKRAITYFKLSHATANVLKSLYLMFAGDLIDTTANLLNEVNNSRVPQTYFGNDAENLLLLEYLLKTIRSIVKFDDGQFLNDQRFTQLMEPIIDHMKNSLIKGNENIKRLLKKTIISLGIGVKDGFLWKQLNLYLLNQTRIDDSEIK